MSDEPKTSSTPTNQLEKLPTWGGRSRQKKARSLPGSQEDGFQKAVLQAGRSAKSRSFLLIGAVVVGIAALLGGIALYTHLQNVRAEQTRLLDSVVSFAARARVIDEKAMPENVNALPFPVFTDESTREAEVTQALASLQENAQDSDADLLGQFVKAAQLIRTGQFQTAGELYRTLLASLPKTHPLQFLGQEGLGIALEGQGQLEEALHEFEQLAGSKGQFYRDMALWHQGRLLEQLGRQTEAVAVYKQYKDEFSLDVGKSALASDQVRARLLELAPEELEKPAEPDVALPEVTPAP